MLYVGFGDESAIDVLLVSRSPRQYAAALEPCDDRGDSRLRQLSLGVQLLPDLRDGELALFPEESKDGDLELSELLAVGHQILVVSTLVDSTPVERTVKGKVFGQYSGFNAAV